MPDFRSPAAALILAALAACTPAEEVATETAAAEDACGAAGLQTLVGTSVGALDAATLPEPRRIIFPGQAVTLDLLVERLNVEIGPDDLIARVYCG